MKTSVSDLQPDRGTVDRTKRFGYCPQQPVLYERLTCAEHLDLFGVAYGLAPSTLQDSAKRPYHELDFERFADARVQELSGRTRSKRNPSLATIPQT